MAEQVSEADIRSWIDKVLKDEHIVKYTFEIESTNKSYGYMGNVVFVKVKGRTNADEMKDLYLVVKYGKKNLELRKKLLWGDYYARELFFYSTVIPHFQKFQAERKKSGLFNNVPKCYTTLSENNEVVVLENLRVKGYLLHDKFKNMDRDHIEIILDSMARFHAISFCYQDQNKEEFDSIFGNYGSMSALELKVLPEIISKLRNKIYDGLKHGDLDLADMFKQRFQNGMWDVFKKVLEADVKEKVITHTDCWNNNYLFSYKVIFSNIFIYTTCFQEIYRAIEHQKLYLCNILHNMIHMVVNYIIQWRGARVLNFLKQKFLRHCFYWKRGKIFSVIVQFRTKKS